MKNLILLSLSTLIVQSSVAYERTTPINFNPFMSEAYETPDDTQNSTFGGSLNIEQLQNFTPEAPRILSAADLNAMFQEMKSMNNLSRAAFLKVLPRVKYIQYTFNFTKEIGVRRNREIRTYLIFTYRAIQADLSTDCEQYFHNAYEENKSDFNRVMSTLSPTQRANLYKADDEAKRLQANPIQDDE